LEKGSVIGRQDICPYCRSDLHCCLNCSLYDEYAQNHCRETSAEWVGDRERNNFCDFFTFQEGTAAAGGFSRQKEARAKLEALFKKKTS
jgi:hypothetical protein